MLTLEGLAVAIALAALLLWAWFRLPAAQTPPAVLVEGTVWLPEGNGQLKGPCCDACQALLMARPLAVDSGGVAKYELCCPACGEVAGRRSFTLLELMDLERKAAEAWAKGRAPKPLGLSSSGRHR